MVILDELSIKNGHKKKIKAGETSELEDTLTWLRHNTAMTLAALSSASLLDKDTYDEASAISQTELDEMVARTKFGAVSLNHIMRSSHKIAAATSTASVSAVQMQSMGSFKMQEIITPGSSSSTVPGIRPRAWVYKSTSDVNYSKLAGFVSRHLRTMDTERLKCVVLRAGMDLSTWIISIRINPDKST